MSSLQLNTSYKHHMIVGIIISVWLVSFLIIVAPFDTSDLSLPIRIILMPMYGVISFFGYFILIPIQNYAFKNSNRWPFFFEVAFLIMFNVIVWLLSFLYYKTEMINGTYSFVKFTFQVYYPIFFILLPMLLLSRWYLNKKVLPLPTDDLIVLTGENKHDVLQIKLADLICISSADNYVEVNYLRNNILQKKLLRTTLKNIHNEEPSLIKVHRSHLINTIHFKEWKNTNTLILTEIEVPVSKKYKQEILSDEHSPLK